MRRSWFSVVVVAGVIGLLTLFLGLQYRWLSKVSEAEQERMQKRVEADTARLAEDFNREMQAAYYNFQSGAETWKNSDWSEFNERYDFWRERTAYPELIRGIYFFSNQADSKPLRYEPAQRAFHPSDTTSELNALRSRFTAENFTPVYEDAFAMVVPVYDNENHFERFMVLRSPEQIVPPVVKLSEQFGWLVVLLDESVIKERMFPDLSQKYFAGDYKVAVVDKSGQAVFATKDATTFADASAPMFNMSPDNLLFFANREALPRTAGAHKRNLVISERVESHEFIRGEKDGKTTGTFKVQVQPGNGSKPRTTVMAGSGEKGAEPWTLTVQHTAGSIEAFVNGERNKSFMIGLGIYFLLVGGILAIVLSAMRSKRFAQRQIDFVSSVSHEFRTPLAVIYSAGENLADGVAKESSQVSRYGELIKREGRRLSGMVEQILEFAGADSGKRKYNLAKTNVTDVVKDALSECGPLIESSGFSVETDLQEGLPSIVADRAALASAVQNLIANSVKYSNGSKWVRVSTSNGGSSVKICVEDRGIGIRTDDIRRVFEPFYRAKEVVDAQISGNGLGLNLVKKIAEAHKGKVTVESKPGKGSKFTIELPQS
ncbi:MAG TPA: HAMP domain-containing sensor histidine kinase [Pyrinomonadaceae bacterium]